MNDLEELNSITHFGVLGMKWGKRKRQETVDRASAGDKRIVVANRLKKAKEDIEKKVKSEREYAALYGRPFDEKAFRAKLEKKAGWKLDKNANDRDAQGLKDHSAAMNIRKVAKMEIDRIVNETRAHAAKKNKPFDEKAVRAEMERVFDEDLKMTGDEVAWGRKAELIGAGIAAVMVIGMAGATAILDRR